MNKEEILEKHIGKLKEVASGNITIERIKKRPEWSVILDAMEEYTQRLRGTPINIPKALDIEGKGICSNYKEILAAIPMGHPYREAINQTLQMIHGFFNGLDIPDSYNTEFKTRCAVAIFERAILPLCRIVVGGAQASDTGNNHSNQTAGTK